MSISGGKHKPPGGPILSGKYQVAKPHFAKKSINRVQKPTAGISLWQLGTHKAHKAVQLCAMLKPLKH